MRRTYCKNRTWPQVVQLPAADHVETRATTRVNCLNIRREPGLPGTIPRRLVNTIWTMLSHARQAGKTYISRLVERPSRA